MIRRSDRLLAIAHRSGNTIAGLREALDAGVDLVEADVHAYRGVLEVRHHKNLGPLYLWDKWELVPRRDFLRVQVHELLHELSDDPRLMLDLKGVSRSIAPAVADEMRTLAPGLSLTVCTKHWWMLDEFDPAVRRVFSASNRTALARLRRRLGRARGYGVSLRRNLLTLETVAYFKTRTDIVMTWPVDTPAELDDARALGVDAVISRDLTLLAGVVGA